MNEPSGIFGLSVFWAWAIPLVLLAANVLMILLIRRDQRDHDAAIKAIFAAERLMAAPLESARREFGANVRRASLIGAETGARPFGWTPFSEPIGSAPSREEYEAFLRTRRPAGVDDASFLRSLGISVD